MGPEAKLYQKIKKKTPSIIWNRIENLSLIGMPDALGYNKNHKFFTVEFKVTRGKKLRFSPHQIAWHIQHPDNTFIIAQTLGPGSSKLIHLFRGSRITELVAWGLALEACASTLDACCLELENLN
tara:strand:+ start:83 stop:457 length:375 start_codon:yes stop_codon:yes gene_type:complete